MTATLVVGAGGMLGRAVVAALDGSVQTAAVRWGTSAVPDDLRTAVAVLARDPAVVGGDGWRIVWAAGTSVISSERDATEAETAAVADLLAAVADLLPTGPGGRVVLASSAGAIHAGGGDPPFDEDSVPAPRSWYGTAKLTQERLLDAAARRTGVDAVAVRMGPLYGIGQDPGKAQGLVSALCRAIMDRRPVRLYVPWETRRTYLWAPDAGRLLARIAAAPAVDGGALRLRTVPGGQDVTVTQLVETVRRVTRRRPPVLSAAAPEGAAHARVLRLASRHPEETVLADPTPLTVGVGMLWRALLRTPVRAEVRTGA